MSNTLWITLIIINVIVIFITGQFINISFWIFLLFEIIFDFIYEFGKKGKGRYSQIIFFVGFILFLITIVLSFIFVGWKIAILIFITYFLIGNNLNNVLINKIFSFLRKH